MLVFGGLGRQPNAELPRPNAQDAGGEGGKAELAACVSALASRSFSLVHLHTTSEVTIITFSLIGNVID